MAWFVPRPSTQVLNVEFPAFTTQQFVELFLGQGAFIATRLNEVGSQDVNVSPWKYIGRGRYSRNINHKHPIGEYGWVPWLPKFVTSSNTTIVDYLSAEKELEIVETCTIGNIPLHDIDVILSWRVKDLSDQVSCQVVTSVSFVFHRPSLIQTFMETEGLKEIRKFFLTWSNAVRKQMMIFLVSNQAGNAAEKPALMLPYIGEAIAAAKAGRPPQFGGHPPSMPTIAEDEEVNNEVDHVWKRVPSTEALDLAAAEGTEQDADPSHTIAGLLGSVSGAVWSPLNAVMLSGEAGVEAGDKRDSLATDLETAPTTPSSSSPSSSSAPSPFRNFKRPVRSPSISSDTGSAIAFDSVKKNSSSSSSSSSTRSNTEGGSVTDASVDEEGRDGTSSRGGPSSPRDREYNCIQLFCFW